MTVTRSESARARRTWLRLAPPCRASTAAARGTAAAPPRRGGHRLARATVTANAVSVSVPLSGPELAMAFTFRRFARQGADAPGSATTNLPGAKPAARERCHRLSTRAVRPGGSRASGRRPAPEPNLPGAPTLEQDTAVGIEAGTTYLPATLGAHELVLLHGQPGSAADWQQVAGRLPAQFQAAAVLRPAGAQVRVWPGCRAGAAGLAPLMTIGWQGRAGAGSGSGR